MSDLSEKKRVLQENSFHSANELFSSSHSQAKLKSVSFSNICVLFMKIKINSDKLT